jgi:hypothetical protein
LKPVERAVMNELLGNQIVELSLQYRGSEHGWMTKDFYTRAIDKGPIIMLMKLKNGPCIGGFSKTGWKSTHDYFARYISDSSAMIFNLSNFENYPVKIKSKAISCFSDSICFGDEEIKIA